VDLYEAGEWTWEAMLDIMRRATRDTTGDTVINQFGIAGQPGDNPEHLIRPTHAILADGDLNYAMDHPYTMRALEFAEQIFHEGLWATEAGGVLDAGNWSRNFHSGTREASAALFPTVTWALQEAPPAFDMRWVPFPLGPDNTSGNSWMSGFRQGISVPVGSGWEVEEVLIILEELFSWPGDYPELLFIAGQIDWMRDHFHTEECVQRAVAAGLNNNSDVGRAISGWYWILGDFATAFFEREMDVAQAVAHFRGPQQELLDQRFRD
jgi:hypothetical protein